MEYVDWQLARFREVPNSPALIWRDREFTYADLLARYEAWLGELKAYGVRPGANVAVIADYSPGAVACLLALVSLKCVLVPLSWDSGDQHQEFFRIGEIDVRIELDENDTVKMVPMSERKDHALLEKLRATGNPGLILFSSGSTGKPKAILHDLPPLLNKFRKNRHCYRTITFLLFDHIGGFNTLFYTLANLGCIVVPENRSVTKVCEAIEKHRVELLPTSPSFLNLLLLGNADDSFDLSSIQLVTYGTEVMSERTLKLANAAFPGARFQQTYGLTELGILRSKSASNQSLMVKVGGEDYETKVIDGRLLVRASSSMLGYLNAPSPFDDEGWFDTGDAVIQEGEYYRILGRDSDIVNVGGQKVYPAEVEQVIAEMPDVIDVSVRGETHLLLGQIVVAKVQMGTPIPSADMKKRIHEHCKGRLQPYMIPAKVSVVTEDQVNYRFKKVRR